MPFIVITPPNVGETTKLDTFAQPVIDNLNFLNDQLSQASGSGGVGNGSFEVGTGTDTAPPSWDLVISAGNSSDFETSAPETNHGRQAFSMTTPGAIAGGVSITLTDFFDASELYGITVKFLMKCSVATTKVSAFVRFYDETESFLDAVQIYLDETTNPTAWTEFSNSARPPVGTRLAKLEFIGVDNLIPATVVFDGIEMSEYKTAEVKMLASATIPAGWLVCDGSAVSRTYYSAMFELIGTDFGIGDGATTFNIPDFRGRAGMGLGAGPGATRTMGEQVGAVNHTLTTGQMPFHSHSRSANDGAFPQIGTESLPIGNGNRLNDRTLSPTGTAGLNQAHNNMQPSLGLNFIIRT